MTPGSSYVAGQKLTFTGNLGVGGVRKIHLEFDMGAGLWPDVEGFSAKTRSDGSFSFDFPAPGMWGIKLRVASGSVTTPSETFDAASQDLTLDLRTGGNQVLPGAPFTIEVDTTPTLPHRPDLLQLPAFPGRELTLQRRVGDRWVGVDDLPPVVTDGAGDGRFELPGITSTQTYRVVEGDYTEDGNRIGWFPSFPFTVEVVDNLRPTPSARVGAAAALSAGSLRAGDGATAGKINQWGVSLWDFAWEYGESLTSKPWRGSDLEGWWLDSSTGSGRVAKHNSQLTFDSQRNWSGPGDVGTTTATLRDNPMTYGRWETRLRIKRLESGAREYHALGAAPRRPRAGACWRRRGRCRCVGSRAGARRRGPHRPGGLQPLGQAVVGVLDRAAEDIGRAHRPHLFAPPSMMRLRVGTHKARRGREPRPAAVVYTGLTERGTPNLNTGPDDADVLARVRGGDRDAYAELVQSPCPGGAAHRRAPRCRRGCGGRGAGGVREGVRRARPLPHRRRRSGPGCCGSSPTRPATCTGPPAAGRPASSAPGRRPSRCSSPGRTTRPRPRSRTSGRTRWCAAWPDCPPQHRQVVTCRYLLDLDEAETAAVLGWPRGTVKSRLHRALGKLRDQLDTEQETEVAHGG